VNDDKKRFKKSIYLILPILVILITVLLVTQSPVSGWFENLVSSKSADDTVKFTLEDTMATTDKLIYVVSVTGIPRMEEGNDDVVCTPELKVNENVYHNLASWSAMNGQTYGEPVILTFEYNVSAVEGHTLRGNISFTRELCGLVSDDATHKLNFRVKVKHDWGLIGTCSD
jgi:hypothetical protein